MYEIVSRKNVSEKLWITALMKCMNSRINNQAVSKANVSLLLLLRSTRPCSKEKIIAILLGLIPSRHFPDFTRRWRTFSSGWYRPLRNTPCAWRLSRASAMPSNNCGQKPSSTYLEASELVSIFRQGIFRNVLLAACYVIAPTWSFESLSPTNLWLPWNGIETLRQHCALSQKFRPSLPFEGLLSDGRPWQWYLLPAAAAGRSCRSYKEPDIFFCHAEERWLCCTFLWWYGSLEDF